MAQMVKNLPAMQESQVQALGQQDALEEEMATHSSTLARRIPWTEEPGRLQSMGSPRVGCDLLIKSRILQGRQEYCKGGKNTAAGSHFLLQGIFLIQGFNLSLQHRQVDSSPLCHLGSPLSVVLLRGRSCVGNLGAENKANELCFSTN